MDLSKLKLPVTDIRKELEQVLETNPNAVLQAPPGAGKTTAVPLFLLKADWLQNRKILILAPRRLAARAAALRMSQVLGEKVGRTVGYRVRMDTKVSPATRIEVITEGVLTRMLQNDAALEGVGLVIFDEFHERSLDADLGLALCLDIQGVLNRDLKLLVMSATMETQPVANLLKGAPVITARGRIYPVDTRYVGDHTPSGLMSEVTRTILSAIPETTGSILVFLPGAAEIRRVASQLEKAALGPRVRVRPLLGNLSAEAQAQAISPPQKGHQKIVLASAIAETSLTIEGIQVVVDSGLQRIPRFDIRSGMSRLVTLPLSRASADQRRGRAGRLGPGICYRLWSRAAHATLPIDRRPEILEADLCSLALELAAWGICNPDDLDWLDPPPQKAYAGAGALLQTLGALDPQGKITRHGREMAALPVHPRLAHMLLEARAIGQTRAACDLAALVTERDPLSFEFSTADVDLQLRYDLLQARRRNRPFRHPYARINSKACQRIIKVADRLHRRMPPLDREKSPQALSIGQLLAWAYPDRMAQARPGSRGRYVMTGGQGLQMNADQPLAAERYIVAVEADGKRKDGRIFKAAAYDAELLEAQFAPQLTRQDHIGWDPRDQSVVARRELRLGAIVLRSGALRQPDPVQMTAAMIQGIRQKGLGVLPWNKTLRNMQRRVCFLHDLFSEEGGWPDYSDQHLEKSLDQWLGPYLPGITRLHQLTRIDLRSTLLGRLSYDQHPKLDRLAPTHWTVPSGSRIPIDYGSRPPVLAVRLQEMFGLETTPCIAGGRQALLIHLLSPAGRPVQITQDLAGFWKTSYHEVKKELKGRYPKHYWPDDPLKARPTARAKPRPQ